jgi:membrane protease YdiL (CAAX protease family)
MPQPPIDPALEMFKLGMMLLSITACMNLIFMRRRGPVLPYEPRRPVPWGVVGGILALMMLLSVGFPAVSGGNEVVPGGSPKSISTSGLITAMFAELLIVVSFLSVVAMYSKATARDLGMASSNRERVRDLFIGAAACLAALAPVHITQQAMLYLFFPNLIGSEQPIIKKVLATPDPILLLFAGVTTVVIAPICEEITFRLLFQGWLERWEDERLGWRRPSLETPLANGGTQNADNVATHPELMSLDAAQVSANGAALLPEPTPPRKGVGGLAYGWFPIIVSATVFGLVHYGYGPEPVPIFLLGLVLGYVYQRTHRILPSIVAHALFNLFTMVILWRMMYQHN